MTLIELADRCGIDSGNLSRIERNERMRLKMPALGDVLKALGISADSPKWRAFMFAAARDRLEILDDPSGIAYLPYQNTLRGVPEQTKQAHTYTVIEAAAELGRVQEKLGIKKITVEAGRWLTVCFPNRRSTGC